MTLEIIPVAFKKEIMPGDKLADLIVSKAKLQDGDIIIVSQKVVSKQEGRIVNLSLVIPSILAAGLASEYQKSPQMVETILSETKRIVRMENGILISETKQGFVCANAGVDESNVEEGYATLLPEDPDKSAKNLQEQIQQKSGKKIAVLISDTFGRPFRMGQTNCAVGLAGLEPIIDYAGAKDDFGRILRVTAIAIADELCAAAELVMGKTLRCPVAIVRNYRFDPATSTTQTLIRPKEQDLFR
ncbi:MAG TPA: coenzyme F420-0:L-glutamate ligase [Nitrosopumilaceae archaeon]|nr:coenzyme F420-0:L-glutamate ligase [Nitrosopumilaceae archaeon]